MLRITSHENSDAIRVKLEGMLKGAWVPEMEQYWHKVARRNKALVVDLTDVQFVDMAGRYLLKYMHAKGASFLAVTPLMSELVAEIITEIDLPQ
jgi:anti-anti-sigma regulatory factor